MTHQIQQQLREIGLEASHEWLQQKNSNGCLDEASWLHCVWHTNLRAMVHRSAPSAAAVALRRAVLQSKQQQQKFVVKEPDIRLLVQLEDCVNMAVDREGRLAQNKRSNQRCLKLTLTDGYHHHGNDNHSYYTAMEVATLPDEGLIPFQPGSKLLLLCHALEIRHGMLLLHPGNTIVLGGRVEYMVELYQKQLLKDQTSAGVGMDPTIKALIWNNSNHPSEGDDDDMEVDESERASTDVTALTRTVPANINTNASSLSQSSAPSQSRQQHSAPHSTQQQPRSSPGNGGSFSTTNQSTTRPSSTHRPAGSSAANPYVNSTAPSNNNVQRTQQQSMAPSNNSHRTQQQQIATVPISSSTNTACMPYLQFCDYMKRALTDATVYKHAYGKTFTVALRQIGPKTHFNIEKSKAGGKKSYGYVMIAKYRGGGGDAGAVQLISAKVSSRILEPHFEVPPAEMRKLNKSDKAQASALVSEGGKRVQAFMATTQTYQVTLLERPDDFFRDPSSSLDGNKAIVCLLSVQPSS